MANKREIKGYLFLNSKHSLVEGECYKIYGHDYNKFIADHKLIMRAYRLFLLMMLQIDFAT